MCIYSYYTRQMKIAAVWKVADMAERIKYFKKIPQVQFYKGHSYCIYEMLSWVAFSEFIAWI